MLGLDSPRKSYRERYEEICPEKDSAASLIWKVLVDRAATASRNALCCLNDHLITDLLSRADELAGHDTWAYARPSIVLKGKKSSLSTIYEANHLVEVLLKRNAKLSFQWKEISPCYELLVPKPS